jgi:hypothetical protein
MALPTLTLTDPHNLAADMSLAMSPLQTTDSNTSFEFDRSSVRPGTASSIGHNDDGMSHRSFALLSQEAEEKMSSCERVLHVPCFPNKHSKRRLIHTNRVDHAGS